MASESLTEEILAFCDEWENSAQRNHVIFGLYSSRYKGELTTHQLRKLVSTQQKTARANTDLARRVEALQAENERLADALRGTGVYPHVVEAIRKGA